MKKIISVFLAILILSQLIILPASAKVSSKAEHSWRVVTGLGLADFKESEKEDKVTRAEFAQLITNVLGITFNDNSGSNRGNFERAFYGDFSYDGYSQTEVNQNDVYLDVIEGDESYDAIHALKKLEIMSGDGMGYFHPQNNIKYEEVLKTFIVIASHIVDTKFQGSWPNGYIGLASELDIIIKGVPIGTEITKYQLCQILYKLFDVEMLRMIFLIDDKAVFDFKDGVTFLNEVIGLYAFSGQLEATTNSTITAPYTSKDTSLQINGIKYIDSTHNPIGSMLGREVEAYRTEDGDVVFMTPIDEEEVTVIDAKNLIGYENGKLTYDFNKKVKTIDIEGLPVIYNGVAVPTYTADRFDLNCGSVTITEDLTQDVVIIWNYSDLLVNSTNLSDCAVYDEVTGYRLDLSEENNTVYIFDENGNEIEIKDISTGNILSFIENGTYKEVYLGGKEIKGKLQRIDSNDNQFTIDEKLYEFSDTIQNNNFLNVVSIGMEITAYLNKFGKVFYIVNGKKTGEMTGIITKVYENDDGGISAKIFDDSGEFVNYKLKDKVTFTNSHNETYKVNAMALSALIDGYVGYCVYTVNRVNEITKLQIPLESEKYLDAGEEKIYQKPFELKSASSYAKTQQRLGSNIFLNADVDFYSIPVNVSEKENFIRFNITHIEQHNYFKGIAYYKNDKSPIPEAIVVKDGHNHSASFSWNGGIHVVSDIKGETLRDDDNIYKEIVFTNCSSGERRTLYAKVENGVCLYDNVKDISGSGSYELELGDIVVMVIKNGLDEPAWIRKIYSCNMESPAGPGGNKGWLPGIGGRDSDGDGNNDSISNKFLITKDFYNKWKESIYKDDLFTYVDSPLSSTISTITAQNPYRLNSSGVLATNPFPTKIDGRMVMLGYVVDYVDGIVKLSTQDLSCETYNPDEILNVDNSFVGVNIERYFNTITNSAKVFHVEYYDKAIEVDSGYPEDIYTYSKTGKNCSRMLVIGTDNYIIINDYR